MNQDGGSLGLSSVLMHQNGLDVAQWEGLVELHTAARTEYQCRVAVEAERQALLGQTSFRISADVGLDEHDVNALTVSRSADGPAFVLHNAAQQAPHGVAALESLFRHVVIMGFVHVD